MSSFTFVSLQGNLENVEDPNLTKVVREQFVAMMNRHHLSPRALSALGYTAPMNRQNVS